MYVDLERRAARPSSTSTSRRAGRARSSGSWPTPTAVSKPVGASMPVSAANSRRVPESGSPTSPRCSIAPQAYRRPRSASRASTSCRRRRRSAAASPPQQGEPRQAAQRRPPLARRRRLCRPSSQSRSLRRRRRSGPRRSRSVSTRTTTASTGTAASPTTWSTFRPSRTRRGGRRWYTRCGIAPRQPRDGDRDHERSAECDRERRS